MFFPWKKKKKQEQIMEAFADVLRESAKNANEIGSTLFKQQRPHQSDFGRCESNPIFTSSLTGTEQYLSRLCTKEGKKFTWSPCISLYTTIGEYTDIGEDKYTIYLDGEEYTDLYFILYAGDTKFPPSGLCFSNDSTDWDLEREAFSKGMTGYQLKAQRRKEKEEAELIEKVCVIKQKYPSCDPASEVKNPFFVFLANINFNLVEAYEYIHKDELFIKKAPEGKNASITHSAQYFYDLLCKTEEKRHVVDCSTMTRLELQTAAAKAGVSINDFVGMNKIERENAEIRWNARIAQFKKYAEQAAKTEEAYPQFDLITDMQNKTFEKIADRFGIFTAHEICHFTDYYIPRTHNNLSQITIQEIANGVELNEEFLFCRKCGAKLFSDSTFCHKCGAKVSVS